VDDHARGALNGVSPQSCKAEPWFWIDESGDPADIVKQGLPRTSWLRGESVAKRIRAAKSSENASELWIRR
jgi:hypothetical protein